MGRRPERGLITLEWLLIVAAIAGIAGTSVLIVQQVVDDATDVPPDPVTRVIDADIAAAHIAAEAQAAYVDSLGSGPSYDNGRFATRCKNLSPNPQTRFGDVVVSDDSSDPDRSGLDGPHWTPPDVGPDTNAGTDDDVRARCVLTPRPKLGR